MAAEITNGGLYEQSVRCGKSNCHCASGDLHNGYYYLFFRQAGRLKKVYVQKDHVEQVRSQIKAARSIRSSAKAAHSRAMQAIRECRDVLREINGQKSSDNV